VLVSHGVDGYLVHGGGLLLFASFALVRGFWWAWLFLTFQVTASLASVPFRWTGWWPLLSNAALVALLLARPTRRHATRGRLRLRGRLGSSKTTP
jgi:hypothetical protein